MKKRIFAGLCLLASSLTLVGCNESSSEQSQQQQTSIVEGASLTISQSILRIEKGSTATLTATLLGSEDTITWSSSDNTVATVSGGVITTLKVGTCTISASAAGITKTCSVTVINPTQAALLSISDKAVTIGTGDSYDVTVGVTYKGKAVDTEITIALADGAEDGVISWTKTGNKVTITGVKYGSTKLAVSAYAYDTILASSIQVDVCDVSLEKGINNAAKIDGMYTVELSKISMPGAIPNEFTPDFFVKKNEIILNDISYSCVVEDEEIVTWTNNKLVAVDLGETILTVRNSYDKSALKVKVVVSKAIVNVSGTYETTIANPSFNISLEGNPEIKTAFIEGTDISVFSSYQDGVLTLNDTYLPKTAEYLGDGKILSVESDDVQYNVTLNIYTLIIKSFSDLKLMNDYLKTSTTQTSVYEGYYVLGNNIDCNYGNWNGVGAQQPYAKEWTKGDIWNNFDKYGFAGVFDGKGYNIANFKNASDSALDNNGALFPCITKTGVVKNVSFTAARIRHSNALVCCQLAGRIENVFAEVAQQDDGATSQFNTAAICSMGAKDIARIKNVLVIDKAFTTILNNGSATPTNCYGIGLCPIKSGVLDHVFNVLSPKVTSIKITTTGTSTTADIKGSAKNVSTLVSTFPKRLSEMENDFFKLSNGLPIPRNDQYSI